MRGRRSAGRGRRARAAPASGRPPTGGREGPRRRRRSRRRRRRWRAAPRSKCATRASSEPLSSRREVTEGGLPQPALLAGRGRRNVDLRARARLTRERLSGAGDDAPRERIDECGRPAAHIGVGVIAELDQQLRGAEDRLALPQAHERVALVGVSRQVGRARRRRRAGRRARAPAATTARRVGQSAPLTTATPAGDPDRQARPRIGRALLRGRQRGRDLHGGDERGDPRVEVVDHRQVVQHALVDAQRAGREASRRDRAR